VTAKYVGRSQAGICLDAFHAIWRSSLLHPAPRPRCHVPARRAGCLPCSGGNSVTPRRLGHALPRLTYTSHARPPPRAKRARSHALSRRARQDRSSSRSPMTKGTPVRGLPIRCGGLLRRGDHTNARAPNRHLVDPRSRRRWIETSRKTRLASRQISRFFSMLSVDDDIASRLEHPATAAVESILALQRLPRRWAKRRNPTMICSPACAGRHSWPRGASGPLRDHWPLLWQRACAFFNERRRPSRESGCLGRTPSGRLRSKIR